MFSSNSHKVLFLVFIALLLTASCNFWQSNSDKNKIQNSDSQTQTNIPFSNKEPETFQAEFAVSTFINGKKTERKNFVAKKGEKLLATYGVESSNKISFLVISDKELFLIKHSEKTFQKRISSLSNTDLLQIKWREFLTTKWLNEKTNSNFEKLGIEENLSKYLVKQGSSDYSEVFSSINTKTSE